MDQEAFWVRAKEWAELGDVGALLTQLDEIADDAERFTIGRFLIRKLAFDAWDNRNLDVIVAIADPIVADRERLGGDGLQEANLVCFNMAANLADCWDDGFSREPRHFEKGIDYATKAIAYRAQLSKGPGSMAMAVWALAKHQWSLGQIEAARANFQRCLDLETEAAGLAGKPAAITGQAPDGYLIAVGYVTLMEEDRRRRQPPDPERAAPNGQVPEPERAAPATEIAAPENPEAGALIALGAALREMAERGGRDRENAKLIASQLQITAKNMEIPLDFGLPA